MSSFPAQRSRFSFESRHGAAYAAAAAGCGLAGWLVAEVPDGALVPATAALALVGALALVVVGVRAHVMTSPLILLGVPLLLSLSAAMQDITRIFGDWSLGDLGAAIAIVLAPLAGVAAAMLTAPGRTPRLQRGTADAPYPDRLVGVCLLMCAAGLLVYAREWSTIGGPPLLSSNIDQARFSLVSLGPIHVFTEGLPLAMLIATWARVGHGRSFSPVQRRALEAMICLVPVVLLLSGGRGPVLLPLLTALVVAVRYMSPRAVRTAVTLIPVAAILLSSAIFIARIGQHTPGGPVGTVLYNNTGTKSSPLQSIYRTLSINLGEPLRVVAELRDAHVTSPPFTSSIWFAHNVVSRAVDPQTVTGPNAGGWLTSTYAGQLLLDFGLIPALMFGFGLGACAHALYRRFARGASVRFIWIYAYLAGPIAFAFYTNIFLSFIFPILDVTGLVILSRLLIRPDGAAVPPRGVASAIGGGRGSPGGAAR